MEFWNQFIICLELFCCVRVLLLYDLFASFIVDFKRFMLLRNLLKLLNPPLPNYSHSSLLFIIPFFLPNLFIPSIFLWLYSFFYRSCSSTHQQRNIWLNFRFFLMFYSLLLLRRCLDFDFIHCCDCNNLFLFFDFFFVSQKVPYFDLR